MKEQISIKVNIADRIFPLKVAIEEEGNIRKASELVNKKIKLYTEQYSITEKQASLSMCALELATELINIESKYKIAKENIKEQLLILETLTQE
ncbi:MAG: cell division protein ZapA [Bacteroidota bacterium]|nr:cell division protein ZapA [Bacteroidota bacterium]